MRENPYLWEPEAECGATMKGGRAPILLSCLWKDLPVSRWPLAIFIMSVLCPHCFLLWKSQQFVSVNVRCCMCRIESELSQSAVERGETNSDQDCALWSEGSGGRSCIWERSLMQCNREVVKRKQLETDQLEAIEMARGWRPDHRGEGETVGRDCGEGMMDRTRASLSDLREKSTHVFELIPLVVGAFTVWLLLASSG